MRHKVRYYSIGGGQYILTSDIGSNNCAAVQDPVLQIIFGIVQVVFLNGTQALKDGIIIITLNMIITHLLR